MLPNKKSKFILMEKLKMFEPQLMAFCPIALETIHFSHNVNVTVALKGSTATISIVSVWTAQMIIFMKSKDMLYLEKT